MQLTSFPRSGTTLLENILDAHPAIISSEEREVFGRDLLGALWKESHESIPPSVEAFDRIPAEKLRASVIVTLRRWRRRWGNRWPAPAHRQEPDAHALHSGALAAFPRNPVSRRPA